MTGKESMVNNPVKRRSDNRNSMVLEKFEDSLCNLKSLCYNTTKSF